VFDRGADTGVDIVEELLPAARARYAGQPWVRFKRMQVPLQWPAGGFDLIVFSEVLYFLSGGDIDLCARCAAASLAPSGLIVLVNWLGESDDPMDGHDATERFIAASGLRMIRRDGTDRYRLDVLSTSDPPPLDGSAQLRFGCRACSTI
jgi:hypothetical protein